MAEESGKDAAPAQPLEEAWWLLDRTEEAPPNDLPILAPYEKTRPGFELVVAEALKGKQDCDCFPVDQRGQMRICLWDIWEQEKDPADADDEKQRINDMQGSLCKLSDDDRYTRIQIACLQRCFWTFPANVDLVLEGIAKRRPNLDVPVSCEPPWSGIMAILRRRHGHPAPSGSRFLMPETNYDPLRTRETLIRAYTTILTWWTFGGDLHCLKGDLREHADLAETIYRRLGRPDKLKRLYVGKLRAALGWKAFARLGFDEEACNEMMAVYEAAITEELGGKKDQIGPQIGPQNPCHHGFFRRADHQIANIGAGKSVPLPEAGRERERIHDDVANYVHALVSWLAGRMPKEAVSTWPPSDQTIHRVYEVLGEATPRKRWLVACLWKKLQDNQAHHGRGALDEQPERFALPQGALEQ